MHRTSRLLPVLALVALGLASCSGGNDSSSTATTGAQTTTTAKAGTATTSGGGGGDGSSTTVAAGGGGDEALGKAVCDLLTKVNDDLGDSADAAQYLAQFVLAAASELDVSQLREIGSADAEVSSRCYDELQSFLDHAGVGSLRGI